MMDMISIPKIKWRYLEKEKWQVQSCDGMSVNARILGIQNQCCSSQQVQIKLEGDSCGRAVFWSSISDNLLLSWLPTVYAADITVQTSKLIQQFTSCLLIPCVLSMMQKSVQLFNICSEKLDLLCLCQLFCLQLKYVAVNNITDIVHY